MGVFDSRALLLSTPIRLGLIEAMEHPTAQHLAELGREARELLHLEEGRQAVDVDVRRAV